MFVYFASLVHQDFFSETDLHNDFYTPFEETFLGLGQEKQYQLTKELNYVIENDVSMRTMQKLWQQGGADYFFR